MPDGAIISGVTTATNVSVSGAVTATTFDGSLKTTGTPTLGLGVTINASGVAISGVCTAGIGSFTTVYGDGSNLSGVGVTISPLVYNPTVGDTSVKYNSGIGITFNQAIKAGSGNITLSVATNAGAAGTTVENFGVGSSVTYNGAEAVVNPAANFTTSETYHINYPAGAFTNNDGSSSVQTAWTFQVEDAASLLFYWGENQYGELGVDHRVATSSPVQVPGVTWRQSYSGENFTMAVKTDGTLWAWGRNQTGSLGQNNTTSSSSPVQVGSDTTWINAAAGNDYSLATKTDGTLWAWGNNGKGQYGNNTQAAGSQKSSPVQVPGTTWNKDTSRLKVVAAGSVSAAVKTDGTLWTWGNTSEGILGLNTALNIEISSPTQIPGTTWRSVVLDNKNGNSMLATKTDGTLWGWGENAYGQIAQNNTTKYSSPVQIPGTDWSAEIGTFYDCSGAVKTDGELWMMGRNTDGQLGQGNKTHYSSPVQVPGTTWKQLAGDTYESGVNAIKTDGTLWAWGQGTAGRLGTNNNTEYQSPVQVGGLTLWQDLSIGVGERYRSATQYDTTP